MSRHATLLELQTEYDLQDLIDFHEALDVQAEYEQASAPKLPQARRGASR